MRAQAQNQAKVEARIRKRLEHIWAEVLCLDTVGPEDDFFALGGDSILSVRIVARANQEGLAIRPRDIFEHLSIATLARHLSATETMATATQTTVAEQIDASDQDAKAIHRPPTTRMLRILQLCCKRSTFQELEQIWADTLEEHYEALEKDDENLARFAVWRGRCDLILGAGRLLPSRLIKWLTKVVVSAF